MAIKTRLYPRIIARRALLASGVAATALAWAGAASAAGAELAASEAMAQSSSLLERYVAAFNAHDVDAFSGIVAEAYIQHNGRAGPGIAGLQAALRGYFQTFPDFRMQIEDRIFGGDKVVARATLTATHSRPVQLGPNAPVFQPTGKQLSWGDIDIWRVADGKFVEHWDQSDLAGLARQMRAD
jgi:predicted ester cyclase